MEPMSTRFLRETPDRGVEGDGGKAAANCSSSTVPFIEDLPFGRFSVASMPGVLYKSIHMKSPEQLRELHENGLAIAYMGLESGDDVTLKNINKGADATRMIEMGKKLRAAGIKLSITVLLGIAGRSVPISMPGKRAGPDRHRSGYVGALSLCYPEHPAFRGPAGRISPFIEGNARRAGDHDAATELTNGYLNPS